MYSTVEEREKREHDMQKYEMFTTLYTFISCTVHCQKFLKSVQYIQRAKRTIISWYRNIPIHRCSDQLYPLYIHKQDTEFAVAFQTEHRFSRRRVFNGTIEPVSTCFLRDLHQLLGSICTHRTADVSRSHLISFFSYNSQRSYISHLHGYSV